LTPWSIPWCRSLDPRICDPNDRTVTTEEEFEVYHAGGISAESERAEAAMGAVIRLTRDARRRVVSSARA
jgi:hypothetical protein